MQRSYVLLTTILAIAATADGQAVMPYAQVEPKAVRLRGNEYIVPQLILGGEWTSSIKLLNAGTGPIPTTNVSFFDNNGNSMPAAFQLANGRVVTDVGFSFSLPVGTMIDVTFFGGSSTQFGHARIECSSTGTCGTPGLYGEVTLRNHNPIRPDFESVFPLEEPATTQLMLFDGRNGLTTVLYLVNNTPATAVVALDFVDVNNRLIRTVSRTMVAGESQILTVHVLVPETIGTQGFVVIRGQSGIPAAIVATALRINPSDSFTPVRTFVPAAQ